MGKIDEYLKFLVEHEGSDLHLIAGNPPITRIHGTLEPIPGESKLDPQTIKQLTYEIINEEQIKEFESDPDRRYELDFAYSLSGIGRFRCNVHKQRGSVAVTMRALATIIPPIESLGLPESVQDFTKEKKA